MSNHPSHIRPILAYGLIAIGIATTWYFALNYDTSIEVEREVVGHSYNLPDRVENTSLQQNRLIGTMGGLTLFLSGIILMAAPRSNTP
jgi:hypothetical protein